LIVKVGFKVPPHWVSWAEMRELWRVGGELDVFESAWTMDHLDLGDGPVWESWTSMAALAHLVPGRMVGQLVGANPFRHPALVAKMATVMDHATGGRFVLGIGSGSWPPELAAFGFSEATDAERLRDLEAGLKVIRALFGRDGFQVLPPGGVSLDAAPYRLADAHNDPPPLTSGGPPIWLGTQGEKVGPRLFAQYADGWNHSSLRGDVAEFRRKRDIYLARAAEFGRGREEFTISAQFLIDDHGAARDAALALGEAGCDHVILFMDPRRGPAELEGIARDIAEPVRQWRQTRSAASA
jgi:alkanesulfonate monooxygenase SsuD/methylene tetrahydromethanopterin reductase-like flavin-dependent oxidoreductase (luciferase family)